MAVLYFTYAVRERVVDHRHITIEKIEETIQVLEGKSQQDLK